MSKFHRLLWFGAVIAVSLVASSVTYAADLNYSADTSVALTGGSVPQTITVLAGSGASSVVVNAGTLIATVPAGTSFSVSSAFYKILASAAAGVVLTESCTESQIHTATVSSQNTATQTVTFSAASHRCGGVHSSAGAGASFTTPPSTTSTTSQAPTSTPTQPSQEQGALIASLEAQLRNLQAQLAILIQARSTGSTTVGARFSRNLSRGMSGDDVTALQEFLKSQGSEIYPEGLVSGYFGNLTRQAVGRWQVEQGLLTDDDPAYGSFGPRTRAAVTALVGP